MKTLFLMLFVGISQLLSAQMPNISKVWTNNGKPYIGVIGNKNTDQVPIKVKIIISEQDRKNDQEYFVSGTTIVGNNLSNFEGKIKITKYKDAKKKGTVFADFSMLEEPKGKHSGTINGKLIYTFSWNKKTEKIEKPYIEFVGNWQNYEGNLNYRTNWKNE